MTNKTPAQEAFVLTPYQLRVWKRNLPRFIVKWQRDCLVAYTLPRLPVLCTHVMNEPIWRNND